MDSSNPRPVVDFNQPVMVGKELEYIAQAVSRAHISGDGYFTQQCQALLEREIGARKALLTTSCTHALEMAALLLDIRPGDEVIVPSFTFVSTINAFVLRGAVPVFADIRPDTLNLDENLLPRLISSRTRAILAVHYAGVACAMDAILEIAGRYGISVVEDNAHGLFGRYQGRPLGSLGCLATQSFHETKNITCGEGGALLINDARLIERAEILREKGTDRSRFFRGQVDKYGWVDVGSSYLPSDLLGAYLLAQLEAREQIQARRMQIWNYYAEQLCAWAEDAQVRLPIVPRDCQHPAHLFYLLMPSLAQRQAMIAHLKSRGVLAVFHYLPLHNSAMGKRLGGIDGSCPVTEDVSDRLLRLPLHLKLSQADLEYVVRSVQEFKG